MSTLSDESRAELEALRASLRRKALPRGSVTRHYGLTDYVKVSESEAGFLPPTDEQRELERQRLDARETRAELRRKPRAWTTHDDRRHDGFRAVRDDEGEIIAWEKQK